MKIIAYHGGNLDDGIHEGHLYFTDDIETAKLYGGENNPNYKLYKCELTFENPLELNDEEYDEYMQQMNDWEQPIRDGYDSIISTETGFATYYVALNPIKQVKILNVLDPLKEDFNDNFWKWFKNSKVVDKQGNPLIVYHGTDAEFNIFNKSGGFTGHYFTDNKENAKYFSEYGFHPENSRIMACYLKIENPYKIYADGKTWQELQQAYNLGRQIKNAKNSSEYDGVIIYNIVEGSKGNLPIANDYIVFNANQIKSVDNKGKWSNSDNIYEALNKELENLLN